VRLEEMTRSSFECFGQEIGFWSPFGRLDSRVSFLVGRAAACQREFLEGYEAFTKD